MASWNALTIAALAEAAFPLRDPALLARAEAAFGLVFRELTEMRMGQRRVLRHIERGSPRGPGFLDDQAFVADAAITLYEATGDAAYIDAARELTDAMLALYLDEESGFFFTPRDGETLIARPRDWVDHSVPSATSMACQVRIRLLARPFSELNRTARRTRPPPRCCSHRSDFFRSAFSVLVFTPARVHTLEQGGTRR